MVGWEGACKKVCLCWRSAKCLPLSINLYVFIWWAGKVHAKKSVCVGDLQSVFHYLLIYLHLSGGLGRCMQKKLSVLEIRKERRTNSCLEQCHIPPLPRIPPPPQHPISQPPNHEWYDSWLDTRMGRGHAKAVVHLWTLPHLLQILATNSKIVSTCGRSHPPPHPWLPVSSSLYTLLIWGHTAAHK